MAIQGYSSKGDKEMSNLGQEIGELWNEYVAQIPTEQGILRFDETGRIVNIVSVQGFFEYLGRKAES
jgi:hypothetical protein